MKVKPEFFKLNIFIEDLPRVLVELFDKQRSLDYQHWLVFHPILDAEGNF